MAVICEHCKRAITDTERLLEFDGYVFCTDCFSERVEVYYQIGDETDWLPESETEEYTCEEYEQLIADNSVGYVIVCDPEIRGTFKTFISAIFTDMDSFNYSLANEAAGRSPLVFESKENALVATMFLALNNKRHKFKVEGCIRQTKEETE